MHNTLLIDIGNTAIKWQFNGNYDRSLISEFDIKLLPRADKIFVSCVGDTSILDAVDNVIFVKPQATFDAFQSAYQESKSLGVDRFLAMIGALSSYPNQHTLIIDAGSALTFDLILDSGKHQGGLIAPGLSKLRTSFAKFSTSSSQVTVNKLANNTQDAWEFGTSEMLMSMINTQIEKHFEELGDVKIVLTGGDAKIIALRLNYSFELRPNLVLEGLAKYAQTHSA